MPLNNSETLKLEALAAAKRAARELAAKEQAEKELADSELSAKTQAARDEEIKQLEEGVAKLIRALPDLDGEYKAAAEAKITEKQTILNALTKPASVADTTANTTVDDAAVTEPSPSILADETNGLAAPELAIDEAPVVAILPDEIKADQTNTLELAKDAAPATAISSDETTTDDKVVTPKTDEPAETVSTDETKANELGTTDLAQTDESAPVVEPIVTANAAELEAQIAVLNKTIAKLQTTINTFSGLGDDTMVDNERIQMEEQKQKIAKLQAQLESLSDSTVPEANDDKVTSVATSETEATVPVDVVVENTGDILQETASDTVNARKFIDAEALSNILAQKLPDFINKLLGELEVNTISSNDNAQENTFGQLSGNDAAVELISSTT
jgi:hypothetical protein